MNFEDFTYNTSNVPKNYDQKTIFFEELKNKFYGEIKKNRYLHNYFDTYNTDSVESFMLNYATKKAHLAENYSYYINEIYQYKELEYREITEKTFNLILQKKLWNMQLQWRANQIDIKEIRVTWDFLFWSRNISSCPFLPKVTASEVEILKQFLSDSSFMNQTDGWYYNWQNYDELMYKDEDDDISLPEWYEFYDNHMGTGLLLQLPNLRGEKEDYYGDIGRQYFLEKSKKEIKDPPPTYAEIPPHIFSDSKEMLKFAQTFEEDKHFVELFNLNNELYNQRSTENEISDFEIDKAIDLLKEAEFPVQINGGSDWRKAIVQCSQQYLNSIVINEIDTVFEEYKMLSEIGLSKNDNESILNEYDNDSLTDIIIRNVLKGRELCGEPPTLDY